MVIGPSINQSTNQSINCKILKVTVPQCRPSWFRNHFLICWFRFEVSSKGSFLVQNAFPLKSLTVIGARDFSSVA